MEEWLFSVLKVEGWHEFWWVALGLGGQLMFSGRFLVQWIASERARRSVVPVIFWYFSVGGGALLFTYALWRGDPVFVLGQGIGLFIYLRNLWLIHARKRDDREAY